MFKCVFLVLVCNPMLTLSIFVFFMHLTTLKKITKVFNILKKNFFLPGLKIGSHGKRRYILPVCNMACLNI